VKAYFFNTRRIKCGGELAKNFFDKTMRLKKDSDDDGGKNNLHLLHISPTCIHLKRHTCE